MGNRHIFVCEIKHNKCVASDKPYCNITVLPCKYEVWEKSLEQINQIKDRIWGQTVEYLSRKNKKFEFTVQLGKFFTEHLHNTVIF